MVAPRLAPPGGPAKCEQPVIPFRPVRNAFAAPLRAAYRAAAMIDLIKKTILAGIGATIVTKEKIEVVMQDLVKQGKVSADEAKNVASKLAEEGRKEWESSSKDLAERIRELLAKADFAHKTEVAQLERRIQLLEEKVEATFKLPTN